MGLDLGDIFKDAGFDFEAMMDLISGGPVGMFGGFDVTNLMWDVADTLMAGFEWSPAPGPDGYCPAPGLDLPTPYAEPGKDFHPDPQTGAPVPDFNPGSLYPAPWVFEHNIDPDCIRFFEFA